MLRSKLGIAFLALSICLGLVLGGGMLATPAEAVGGVGMMIDPTPETVTKGQTFTVDIVVTVPGGSAVDFATASIDFDTTRLDVVSITGGVALPETWHSDFDYVAGTLDYHGGAGIGDPDATADFVLATVEFLAQEASAGTPLTFVNLPPERDGMRQTRAVLDGGLVLDNDEVYNGNIIINLEQFDLTVTSSGCCPIDVGIPGQGVQTVAAGATQTFNNIDQDTVVTLLADDSDVCCEFQNWTGDVANPGSASTTVTMDGDKTVIANCDIPGPYTLTVVSDGCCPIIVDGLPGGQQTVGAGQTDAFGGIVCGTVVTITADDSDACCEFQTWVGDVANSQSASTTVTVDNNKTVTADCDVPGPYTLTVVSEGCCPITVGNLPGDDVIVQPGGSEVIAGIPCGTEVTLVADDSDVCCQFQNWTGDVASAGSASTTVTVDGSKTVTANCAPPGPYTLTVNSSGCCPITVGNLPGDDVTVQPGGSEAIAGIPCGTVVTLVADDSDVCCEFDYWTGDVANTGSASTTVTVDSNKTVTGECYDPGPFTLTVVSDGCCPITVTGLAGPDVVVQPGTSEDIAAIMCGTYVTLIADDSDVCCVFEEWTGDVSSPSAKSTVVTVDDDKTVTAHCDTLGPYTLTVVSEGCCPITVGGLAGGDQIVEAGQTDVFSDIDCGTIVTLTADDSDDCCEFQNWVGDVANAGSASTTVTVDTNKTVTANCIVPGPFMLTVNADPAEGGTVTGGGLYDCGDDASAQAFPNEGYYFVGWSGDVPGGSENDNPVSIYMDGAKTITANFVLGTTLEGHVDLQGRSAAPDAGWVTPLTVVFYETGNQSNILGTEAVVTDNAGVFTVADLEPGTMDVGVKCPRSLGRVETSVVITGATVVVNFATLLEGDCDDDDYVGPFDYSLLRAYYGLTTPAALEACDLNRDGFVDGFDYSLLRMNYGIDGEMLEWPLP